MNDELLAFDQAYQKKKKTVVIVSAVLIILLAAALLLGQGRALFGPETPVATEVAVVTTAPPASATFTPSPPATATPLPTETPTQAATPTVPTAAPTQTQTEPPPTTPPPTPTATPSPTPRPPTSTPTLPPPTPVVPVIQNPLPESELPGDALTVFGTAAPGATVQVYEGDTLLGEAAATESGNWSVVPSQPLAAGEHTIVAIDAATGQASAPVTFSLLEALLPITGNEAVTPSKPRFP